MPGEAQRVYGTLVTLEANGAAIANNAVGQADDAAANMANAGGLVDTFDAEFALTVSYAAAPTAGSTVSLILRPLNYDGTADSPVPTAAYLNEFFGSFPVLAVTGAQTVRCFATDVPREFEAYLFNNNTGQSIPAGWALRVRPVTYRPAP